MRIGHGYDVHRLAENRKMIIGGVDIPYEKGLLGHSDADVLIHAVIDSILGALALGDIGTAFPDTDDSYLNISSVILLEKVFCKMTELGYIVGNIDATIVAQKPKMLDYIYKMRENISLTLCTSIDNVNIKATTEEKLGFTGNLEGISAHSVCLIHKK